MELEKEYRATDYGPPLKEFAAPPAPPEK